MMSKTASIDEPDAAGDRRQDPCRHINPEIANRPRRGENSGARGLAPPRSLHVPLNRFGVLLEKVFPGIFREPDHLAVVVGVGLIVAFCAALIFST